MLIKQRRFLFPLTIQYDNRSFADGFGAQALRIVGIFSIARRYGLRYVHQPIHLDHPDELLGPDSSDQNLKENYRLLRALLALPSDNLPTRVNFKVINRKTITRRILFKLILKSIFSRTGLILNLQLPQGITDYRPDILERGAVFIRSNLLQMSSSNPDKSLVLHVRTGNRTVKTPRFNALPQLRPDYFKSVMENSDLIRYKVIVHTDLFPEDLEAGTLTFRSGQFADFLHELSTSYKAEIKNYAPMIEVLFDMASCEILVMGNSALSYFAGLLNTNTVYWPPIHGHAKLSRWQKGPELVANRMTFLDPTDYTADPGPDHTVYRSRITDNWFRN